MFFQQLIEMNFVFGKSLLFYTDNPYFFATFYKMLSLLVPTFFVEGHMKACEWMAIRVCWRP